jgi:hypothetical protein
MPKYSDFLNHCNATAVQDYLDCVDIACYTPANIITARIDPSSDVACDAFFNSGIQFPEAIPPLNLTGDGACVWSDAPFKSAFHSGVEGPTDPNDWALERQCRVLIYNDPDCEGEERALEGWHSMDVGCALGDGMAARLDCVDRSNHGGEFWLPVPTVVYVAG